MQFVSYLLTLMKGNNSFKIKVKKENTSYYFNSSAFISIIRLQQGCQWLVTVGHRSVITGQEPLTD